MAISIARGWTAASLLPGIAAGFSPGFSVSSRQAPAQVTGNPNSLRTALAQRNDFHTQLIQRILGSQAKPAPVKTPGINPAVNNLTTTF